MLQKANTNVIGTKSPPINLCFFVYRTFSPLETRQKSFLAFRGKMLYKTCILIWPVTGCLHGEINAN